MKTATPEVRAVYDDIMATRGTKSVNNFWKALAAPPRDAAADLGKHQANDGAWRARSAYKRIDLCGRQRYEPVQLLYCVALGLGANKGMTDEMFAELMAVVGMANETNRLASGYQVEIDEAFLT